VTIAGNRFRHDISVGADGAYSLAVEPGRYVEVGHSANLTVNNGAAACPAPHDAQVAAGDTTTLDAFRHLR
jgi:hypothetical protein